MSERIENCLKSSYDPEITVGTGRGMAAVLQHSDGILSTFAGTPTFNGKTVIGVDLGMADFYKNNRMVINPNQSIVTKIIKRINDNDGYCPCQPREESIDTRCPCLSFLNTAKCCCSLFVSASK